MRKIPAHIVAQYIKEMSWLDEQTKQLYKENFDIEFLVEYATTEYHEGIGSDWTLLIYAFNWTETEQGHDFWSKVDQHLCRQMNLENIYE